jgi:hypothetical protein
MNMPYSTPHTLYPNLYILHPIPYTLLSKLEKHILHPTQTQRQEDTPAQATDREKLILKRLADAGVCERGSEGAKERESERAREQESERASA